MEAISNYIPNDTVCGHFYSLISTFIPRMQFSKRIHGLDWWPWNTISISILRFLQKNLHQKIITCRCQWKTDEQLCLRITQKFSIISTNQACYPKGAKTQLILNFFNCFHNTEFLFFHKLLEKTTRTETKIMKNLIITAEIYYSASWNHEVYERN